MLDQSIPSKPKKKTYFENYSYGSINLIKSTLITKQSSYYAWFCPFVIHMEYIMRKTMPFFPQYSCISRRIFLIKKAELVQHMN